MLKDHRSGGVAEVDGLALLARFLRRAWVRVDSYIGDAECFQDACEETSREAEPDDHDVI